MKKYSTISEISKLLGLSTDTIRFYEKKGLVHPHVNPENNYRMYTLMNVLELLDVIYYRHLDFPLSDIYELSKTLKPSYTIELIEKKEEETKRKIYYEQQLLKKISHIKSMFHMIEHHENECSIQDFKESIILFEGKDKEDFFIHDIQYMTQDQFDAMMENWMSRQAKKKPTQQWEIEGLERVVKAGVTDGSRPMGLCTRLEAAMMAAANK